MPYLILVQRALGLTVTMIAVSLVAFALLTLAPGDAADAILGDRASQSQLVALRSELRLDEPLPVRYVDYIAAIVLRGDLGRSLASGQPVSEIIAARIGPTLLLAAVAMLLAVLGGVTIGVLTAAVRGPVADALTAGTTAFWLAVPAYWVAMMLVLVFSVRLRLLPVFGAGTPAHLLLPAIALAIPGVAMVARLVRTSTVEAACSDYARAALGKGLSRTAVLVRHALPNSLIPALTVIGLHLSHLIGGTFVIESLFAWPGLGRLTVQAVLERDIPVVMGAVMVVAPLCLLVNLAVDIAQVALDPRARTDPA